LRPRIAIDGMGGDRAPRAIVDGREIRALQRDEEGSVLFEVLVPTAIFPPSSTLRTGVPPSRRSRIFPAPD